jgi:hypothetical protein
LPKLPNEFPREFNLLPSQFIQNPAQNLSNPYQKKSNKRKRSKIDNDLILIQTQDGNDSSALDFCSEESAEEDPTDLISSPPIPSIRKSYSQSMHAYRENVSTQNLQKSARNDLTLSSMKDADSLLL